MLRDVIFFPEVTGVVPDSLSAGGCWREGGVIISVIERSTVPVTRM